MLYRLKTLRTGFYSDVNNTESRVLKKLDRMITQSIPTVNEKRWREAGCFGYWTIDGHVTYLSIEVERHRQFEELPYWKRIGRLKDLKNLPDDFGNLQHLESLQITSEQLTSLPESFGELTKLRRLKLTNNRFSEFPEVILKLKNLEQLFLCHNSLKKLPEDIGDRLPNLMTLWVRYNQLTKLPASITKLAKLFQLWVGMNPLQELPSDIGSLSDLMSLNIDQTELTFLPKSISQLRHLRALHMLHNKINTLPEGFEELSLSDLCLDAHLLKQNAVQRLSEKGQAAVRVPGDDGAKWVEFGMFSNISHVLDPPGGVLDVRNIKEKKRSK